MIFYDPNKFLRKIAPGSKIEAALKANLSVKKTALVNASAFDFLDPKAIARVALKTLKGYRKRVKEDPDARSDILADPKQLIQRIQNEVVFQISNEIKEKYDGEFYRWVPSDADEPDPEHQLNYGKTFQVGDGEMPGDRYGCRCGMEILVADSRLEL